MLKKVKEITVKSCLIKQHNIAVITVNVNSIPTLPTTQAFGRFENSYSFLCRTPGNRLSSICLTSANIFGFGGACDRPRTVSQAWFSKGFNSSEFICHISLAMKSRQLFFSQFFVRFSGVGNLSTLNSLGIWLESLQGRRTMFAAHTLETVSQ